MLNGWTDHRLLLLMGVLGSVLAGSAHAASPSDFSRDAEEIASRSKPIIEDGRSRVSVSQRQAIDAIVGNTRQKLPEDFLKEADRISSEALVKLKEPRTFAGQNIAVNPKERALRQAKASVYTGEKTYLFVSQSMGMEALRKIVVDLEGRRDVVIVLRGLQEEQSIDGLFNILYKLKKGIKKPPAVIMDDRLFEAFNIQAVPAMVHVSDAGGSAKKAADHEVIRVLGIERPDYLKEKMVEGVRGDLGKRGPVFAITELPLKEVIRRRVAKIDWKAKAREAYRRAWRNFDIEQLSPAPETRVRTVSAFVVATADIRDSKGRVIVAKGTEANQLEIVPWHGALVVFNPEEKRELDWVITHRNAIEKQFHPVKYLITSIDRSDGWDDYERIKTALDRHVYVLLPDVKRRFELTHTISIVAADNDRKTFIVKEVRP
ncbi:hypothetical protein D6779_04410 [Candidatus Parcubacteria bacterium]|nr:MAG: hypothetical protein D6779_04410 [Candidatus Parcubacteria bacterium]